MTIMTRNVKVEFETAVFSMRSALKAALDDPEFNRNTLTEVWRAYLGWLAIYEALPAPKEEIPSSSSWDSSVEESVYDYLSSSENFAAGPVDLSGAAGQDIITFSN